MKYLPNFATIMLLLLVAFVVNDAKAELNKAEEGMLMFMATGIAITQIPEPDKASHAFMGMTIAGLCTPITKSPWWCLGAAAFAGAAKEAYDKNNHGVAEWADFYYTLAGGAVAAYTGTKFIQYGEDLKRKRAVGLYEIDKDSNVVMYDVEGSPRVGLHRSYR